MRHAAPIKDDADSKMPPLPYLHRTATALDGYIGKLENSQLADKPISNSLTPPIHTIQGKENHPLI